LNLPIVHMAKPKTCFLVLAASTALLAQTPYTAVLFGTGSVLLNGEQLSNSSAVTSGDVIQTKDGGAANVSGPGVSAVIDSNSIVRYRAEGFSLDRGNISVATGKSVSVFARDLKITPVSGAWTEFYVTRSSGSIGILARKNSVTVNCGASSETVREGQQISRADANNCGLLAKDTGAPAAAKGPIITTTRAELGAIASGAAIAGWVLTQVDDPVSPDKP
jgi:hypothetical protein